MLPVANLAGVDVGGNHPVRIMGVLNVSPESFYKGSVASSAKSLLQSAVKMVEEGADFIDIGAMSSAPYLKTHISTREESRRIRWALQTIRKRIKTPLSIDSFRFEAARIGQEEGADILNDITGLRFDSRMAGVAARAKGVVLMAHPLGLKKPGGSPLSQTKKLLKGSLKIAVRADVSPSRIVLDPGIGFFRQAGLDWWEWDLRILKDLKNLLNLGRPLLVGISRKSFIGRLLGGVPAEKRLAGSLAATAIAIQNGATLMRTHDVGATKEAIRVAEALRD